MEVKTMNVIEWMAQTDVSLEYLTNKYLLNNDDKYLKDKVIRHGYAQKLMYLQDPKTLLWGNGVYSPKYISTHYTLLELCQLRASLSEPNIIKSIEILFEEMWKDKGKVRAYRHQDLCVVAMMVRIGCSANLQDSRINEMIDYILEHQMNDGGYNCAWERKPKPKQSSLHTTLSVLEAFNEYINQGYDYRLSEVEAAIPEAIKYILTKKLFRSVRTNEIIHQDMLMFPFPYGWKYDILRALTVMAEFKYPYDERMEEALSILLERLDEFGRIKANRKPQGLHHFLYTKVNKYCPFNTLRALRVIKFYRNDLYDQLIKKEIN
jgi:hypothetical protein